MITKWINAGFNPLQAIMQMTGETMQEVTARYEEGAISVEEVTQAMAYASSEGGKYYQSMEKQSKTLAGQLSTLKDNVSSLAGTLSEGLSKTISGDVLPSINDLISNLEKAFSEDGISGLAEALSQGLVDIVTKLVNEAPAFLDVALSIIQNLVTGLKNNLSQIVTSAIQIAKLLINTTLDMLPEILQLGIDLVIELVNGIAEAAPDLIPKIVETMLKLFMIITDPENLSRLMDAGVKLLFALIEGIIKSLPKLLENGETTLKAFLNVLSGGQFLMAKLGWALLTSLIKGLIDMIPGLKDKAIEIKDAVINAIKNGISTIFNVGSNLVQGLWNGISGSLQWIKNKISGWVGNVMDFIKRLFGIHSPSTVMRDEVGKYLAQGMGVGFDKELPSIYDDMQRAIDLETEKMSANVQTSGTYQMAMAGTPTFNLLDNTENTTQLVVNGKVLAEVVNTENRNREVASA